MVLESTDTSCRSAEPPTPAWSVLMKLGFADCILRLHSRVMIELHLLALIELCVTMLSLNINVARASKVYYVFRECLFSHLLMVMVVNRLLLYDISLFDTNTDKENKYYLIINYSLLY